MDFRNIGITSDDLFSEVFTENLFHYTQDEVDMLRKALPANRQKMLFEQIKKVTSRKQSSGKVESLIDYLRTLTNEDVKHFEKYVANNAEYKPGMLWGNIHDDDIELYKTQDNFFDWISTLSDEMLDYYADRALTGKRLHSSFVYNSKKAKVEILDGFIAISSSNLNELTKFRDRMIASTDTKCEFEHRVKKHGDVTIHSYIFNMGAQNSI